MKIHIFDTMNTLKYAVFYYYFSISYSIDIVYNFFYSYI